jgi:predicted MPP superfamily phosphohydrolase
MLTLYAYANLRLTDSLYQALLLAIPFFCLWLVPFLYWVGGKERGAPIDYVIQFLGYLSMGFVNFLIISLVATDFIIILSNLLNFTSWHHSLSNYQASIVLSLTVVILLSGILIARRGPSLHEVEVRFPDLPHDLEGYRIVQITDLHIGVTLKKHYVENVVKMTKSLIPDLIVLTGDIVDGSVEELAEDAAPLSELAQIQKTYLALGNHDYYSGASQWTEHFQKLGMKVLLNSHEIISHGTSKILIGGVTDPASSAFGHERPDAMKAIKGISQEVDLRILLAHNPKLVPLGEKAGFNLQLSGHTHAGQFIPWTYIVRAVHSPHYWGLSKMKEMWVYVSAGTGTWGPPIRFGSEPELTLLRFKKS